MNDAESKKLIREDAVIENKWQILRKFTDARIGLGRAGPSQTTKDVLSFQLAHARAQDAVNTPVDWHAVESCIQDLELAFLHFHSQAVDRSCYLQRPDLGRCLNEDSRLSLNEWRGNQKESIDICIVIADGLSATAIETQAPSMLKQLIGDLSLSGFGKPFVCLADQARVAIGDEIAEKLNAECLVVMIGERPGLSSPNSLGIYFSYQAKIGFTDAKRNCLSNIRPEGLSFSEASQRLIWLMKEAKRQKLSGVSLKDESQVQVSVAADKSVNLLTQKSR